MKKIIFKSLCFALVALTSGCEDKTLEKYVNTYEISINNSPIIKNQAAFSINENCGLVFSSIWLNDEYVLDIELSDVGAIRKILLIGVWPKNDRDESFRSVDFIPGSTFQIKNFQFDKLNKKISFDFEGKLMDPRNFPQYIGRTVTIKGKIEDKNLIIAPCRGLLQNVKATVNGFLYTENMTYSLSESSGKTASFSFSENGYSITFLTSQQLKDMDLKSYSFGKNSTNDFITFEKYIGPIRSTQYITPPKIDGEWEKYNYEGSFTITEKINSNGRLFTKGVFSLNVYDKITNDLLYTITNGEFYL
jgi:hypothetical protein